jgi:hypothetical protein
MTLYELITKIKEIALSLPNVQEFNEGDFYVLNQSPSRKYKSVVLTQQTHSENLEDNTITYRFNIFEVDRLEVKVGAQNKLQIQSTVLNDLHTLFKKLSDEDVLAINQIQYFTFEHRFNDLLSGAYASLEITTNIKDCENYEENM